MYIHRIVIDANCINAKGRLDAMTTIEAYHDAGIVEIIKTSTLDAEFSTAALQKEKSRKYKVIGGSGIFSYSDGTIDAMPGATSGDSRFYQYYLAIFENFQGEKSRHRSIRDCLHIDQAILNNADYFVTNEKALIEGSKRTQAIREKLDVITPEDCLSRLRTYFDANYGTSNLDRLAELLNSGGPIILGSNRCGDLTIKDPSSTDVLLSFWIRDSKLIIECQIRDCQGNLILVINEGKIQFHSNGARIKGMGYGPLLVGESAVNQIYIGNDTSAYLSARALSSGRVLFDRVELNSADGQRRLVVKRDAMHVQGLVFGLPTCTLTNHSNGRS